MYKNSILVSKSENLTRIAELKNGEVAAFYAIFPEKSASLDSIYLGKAIVKNSHLVFVDIGLKYPGLLKEDKQHQKLTDGQKVIVQITREAFDDSGEYTKEEPQKGVKLTRNIRLANRYFVYKIGDQSSMTSRTAAQFASDKILENTKESLRKFAEQVQQSNLETCPRLLHRGPNSLERLLRDSSSSQTVLFDNHEDLANARTYCKEFHPEILENLTLAPLTQQPLFEHFGVEDDWENLFTKNIRLTCGGHIVIETTACATTIDVNQGSADLLTANLEAISCIVKQIRLRQISGNIIVDFAGIQQKTDYQQKLLLGFKNHIKKNVLDVHILGWSMAGFLELRRQKLYNPLALELTKTCESCSGWGRIGKKFWRSKD